MTTKLCDYTNVRNAQCIAKPITSHEISAKSFEVSPGLLNLICKDLFGCSAGDDFCEICDMQKFRNIYNSETEIVPLFIKRKS
jgi:hypothetical protein